MGREQVEGLLHLETPQTGIGSSILAIPYHPVFQPRDRQIGFGGGGDRLSGDPQPHILDSPRVFAAILMILVLAVAYDMLSRSIERRMVVWQSAGRAQRSAARPAAGVPAPAAA